MLSSPHLYREHHQYNRKNYRACLRSPFTTVKIEQIFSKYKNIYRDNRLQFLFENLRMVVLTTVTSISTLFIFCLENEMRIIFDEVFILLFPKLCQNYAKKTVVSE